MSSYTNDHFNPYVRSGEANIANKTFAQTGYYYIEVVTINGGSNGFCKLMVDIP
jgi:hypothetical protein